MTRNANTIRDWLCRPAICTLTVILICSVLHGVFVYNVVSVIKLYGCLFAFVSVCEKLVLEHGANVQEENCKRYYSN
ncbi:unnamed protein product [Acanthoscelides obtectus]|uniref:Uncharacterized protein n=1 Tax=Acanthoscelides obtectus TaxID=200917 RepID=A0A9P0PSX7_ACAOB|nr:unnamed protein product [Acanthoscelides obtectus]CAK1654651.1 hypothetical protein AOBTE_LOCUS18739 [Acanthoscelides obtectus]